MKISNLFASYAVVSLVVGVGFLFAPNLVLAQFGVETNAIGIYQSRILGAVMLALAVLTWSTRNIGPSEARNAILLSLFIFEGLGFVLSLIAQFTGVIGPMGWGFVVIFFIFSLALGYARFVKPGAE